MVCLSAVSLPDKNRLSVAFSTLAVNQQLGDSEKENHNHHKNINDPVGQKSDEVYFLWRTKR